MVKESRFILVVGHQKTSPGATNPTLKTSEWDFNFALTEKIYKNLETEFSVVWIYPDVPHWKKAPIINEENKKKKADFVIEFHLNSAPQETVNYCLAKVPRGNQVSARVGTLLISEIEKFGVKKANWGSPDMRVPGIFEADPPTEEQKGWRNRGSNFLFKTELPSILLETFFISNTNFLKEALRPDKMTWLSNLIAGAIRNFYK